MIKSLFQKKFVIIICAFSIPVIIYSVYHFMERNKEEARIREIYDGQLTSLLFSVNQHCWDQVNIWINNIKTISTKYRKNLQSSDYETEIQSYMKSRKYISGMYIRMDETQNKFIWNSYTLMAEGNNEIDKILESNQPKVQRMFTRAEAGYIRPVSIPYLFDEEKKITLLFFPVVLNNETVQKIMLVGLFLDENQFVQEICARKFAEMDNGNFTFAVYDSRAEEMLFSTQEEKLEAFEKNEEVWVIPNLKLLIKLQGTTLQALSQAKTRTNLIFLGIVNVILIFGVLMLLRNINREIGLAKMKTDFVANVSHELRTPLALIRMYAETLEMNRVPSEDKKLHYYKTIMNECTRLTNLINNILDFSKIESGRKEYHLSSVNLRDLVYNALDTYRVHLAQKGFSLEENIQQQLPPVMLDQEAVTLAFVNLIDNAIKFSKNEKCIRVNLSKENEKLILSVKDCGIGIPESEQNKIFEKFYRVGDSLIHNTKGSGLGLSLVKHIMEYHRGEVKVSSQLGVGSTFSLVFPINHKKG